MEYNIETTSCWELTSLLFLDNFTLPSASQRQSWSRERVTAQNGRNDGNQWIGISHIQTVSTLVRVSRWPHGVRMTDRRRFATRNRRYTGSLKQLVEAKYTIELYVK